MMTQFVDMMPLSFFSLSDIMLLNAAKYQGYIFYSFWVIRGKPTVGGGGKITTPD